MNHSIQTHNIRLTNRINNLTDALPYLFGKEREHVEKTIQHLKRQRTFMLTECAA